MARPGVRPYTGILFVLPFLLPFALFSLWPLLCNLWLSLMDYFLAERATAWNGFANYVALTESDYFIRGLKNSLLFLLTVPALQIGALGLALLVRRALPGAGWFRTMYYLPVVVAVSVVAVAWRYVFQYDGLLNSMLDWSHLWPGADMDWLGRPQFALYAAMIFAVWKNVGYYMVLYLAGLQAVPRALHDAALLDGAGFWQRLRHVTLPALQPVILLCTLLATMGALKTFQEVLVLTGGGSDTITLLMFVYGAAFHGQSFGLAAAAAVVMMIICFAVAAVQFRYFGQKGIWGKEV
ncbi:putative chitobiose transport system permease protein [Andreprevotia lacus DSM 23236]|jgi:putative chitobiose transport system permease protein|uniref:Putative chitobiose transport system permease protein n=1 Tax=Andreprevotia lacus DSM 23236 TaxID=1121001 RepID=A0A1W1X5N1_9NEIS|nr:sugar ABC transporter permease [Andreprevotia lacus]SMC19167.1 putative chitobiose transport system permease protein [Andreprevotia lacus DSM 23236]